MAEGAGSLLDRDKADSTNVPDRSSLLKYGGGFHASLCSASRSVSSSRSQEDDSAPRQPSFRRAEQVDDRLAVVKVTDPDPPPAGWPSSEIRKRSNALRPADNVPDALNVCETDMMSHLNLKWLRTAPRKISSSSRLKSDQPVFLTSAFWTFSFQL
ncbi:hypothetical protein EYF80_047912 [Liparis tanakae]|uniref:Uncharacterized protein n=1 Tax=Liparis tanakae TaxID=230148 RepID=A0A4Z2FKY6_9TELE|nr:hypothetical protein EYF80_047912 [Liparis tanakae]